MKSWPDLEGQQLGYAAGAGVGGYSPRSQLNREDRLFVKVAEQSIVIDKSHDISLALEASRSSNALQCVDILPVIKRSEDQSDFPDLGVLLKKHVPSSLPAIKSHSSKISFSQRNWQQLHLPGGQGVISSSKQRQGAFEIRLRDALDQDFMKAIEKSQTKSIVGSSSFRSVLPNAVNCSCFVKILISEKPGIRKDLRMKSSAVRCEYHQVQLQKGMSTDSVVSQSLSSPRKLGPVEPVRMGEWKDWAKDYNFKKAAEATIQALKLKLQQSSPPPSPMKLQGSKTTLTDRQKAFKFNGGGHSQLSFSQREKENTIHELTVDSRSKLDLASQMLKPDHLQSGDFDGSLPLLTKTIKPSKKKVSPKDPTTLKEYFHARGFSVGALLKKSVSEVSSASMVRQTLEQDQGSQLSSHVEYHLGSPLSKLHKAAPSDVRSAVSGITEVSGRKDHVESGFDQVHQDASQLESVAELGAHSEVSSYVHQTTQRKKIPLKPIAGNPPKASTKPSTKLSGTSVQNQITQPKMTLPADNQGTISTETLSIPEINTGRYKWDEPSGVIRTVTTDYMQSNTKHKLIAEGLTPQQAEYFEVEKSTGSLHLRMLEQLRQETSQLLQQAGQFDDQLAQVRSVTHKDELDRKKTFKKLIRCLVDWNRRAKKMNTNLFDVVYTGMIPKVPYQTPRCMLFFTAVSQGDVQLALSYLKTDKAYIYDYDAAGRTAAHKAVLRDDMVMLRALLNYHPDLERKDEWGDTVLAVAVKKSQFSIVKELLCRGADPYRVNLATTKTRPLSEQEDIMRVVWTSRVAWAGFFWGRGTYPWKDLEERL